MLDRGKMVLIQLPSPWLISDRDLPLMGLMYLAGALRAHNLDVQIADLVGVEEEKWQIPEGDVYGISLTTPQAPIAREVVRRLRDRTNHPVIIVGGGPHVSALPDWSLKHLDLDYAFVGESDIAIVNFMRGTPLEEVEGLVWSGGRTNFPRVDLKHVTPPARDMVDIRSFHQVGINRYVKADITSEGYLQTGRGCPFDCAFCAQAAITGRSARYFDVPALVDEVHTLRDKYEVDLIYIEDDTFNIHKKRVLALSKVFHDLDFEWHCLCRADTMDDEVAAALEYGGCRNVTFGFETGSAKMLKAMDKQETMEDAWKAIKSVKSTGMTIRGQMIVGFPGETQESIDETEAFVRAADVDRFGFHAFVPLPGTQVWRNPAKFGIEIDTASEDFAEGYHTIGKPGEWARVWGDEEQTRDWLAYLRDVADTRNIDKPVPGAPDHDKDWAGVQDAANA